MDWRSSTAGSRRGNVALSPGDLGSASMREGGVIGGGIVLAGFVMTLRKPAPQPARGNILYQLAAARADRTPQHGNRAGEHAAAQQVALSVVPLRAVGVGMSGGGLAVGRLRVGAASSRPTAHPPNCPARHRRPTNRLGDYREVSSDLHYRGTGLGAKATLMWKKLSADVEFIEAEVQTQDDRCDRRVRLQRKWTIRLRYYVTGPSVRS